MRNRFPLGMLVALLLLATSVSAANDPGHDTLYVLKLGDSDVVGSINVTQNLSANIIRAATLLYGNQLDIRANGTIQTVSSRPAIQADSSDLYIDANGNLYLNTRGGTSGIIQVGPVTGSAVILNVSGSLRQQGVAVCLSNGTNCISGTNFGNVSSVSAGSGLTDSGTAANPVLNVGAGDGITVNANDIAVDATVCRSDGSNCPATGSGSGWQNTTNLVSLVNNATNVSIGNTTNNQPVLFIDNTDGRVGIGAISASAMLHVNGTARVKSLGIGTNPSASEGVLSFISGAYLDTATILGGGQNDMSIYSPDYLALSAGYAIMVTSTIMNGNLNLQDTYYIQHGQDADYAMGYHVGSDTLQITNGTTLGSKVIMSFDKSHRVGIGTIAPTQKLSVNGSVNVSNGNISLTSTYSMCFNSGCTARIYHNGSALIIEGQ